MEIPSFEYGTEAIYPSNHGNLDFALYTDRGIETRFRAIWSIGSGLI